MLGFVGTDAKGLAGLEAIYEPLLRGRAGRRVLEQDPHGRQIPQGTFSEERPVPGADLVLTNVVAGASSSPPRVSRIAPRTMTATPIAVPTKIHGGGRRSSFVPAGSGRRATGRRP